MTDAVTRIFNAFVAAIVGAILLYVLGVVVLGLVATQPWYAQYGWPIVGAFAGIVIAAIKSK
jgi:biotin transporter BioY